MLFYIFFWLGAIWMYVGFFTFGSTLGPAIKENVSPFCLHNCVKFTQFGQL